MRACPRCHATYQDDEQLCEVDGARLIDKDEERLVGKLLDRYRIVEAIGRGAMSSVYRARHTTLDRDFAIKVLSRDLAKSSHFVERFRREARALSQLRHTNIISVYDFGRTPSGLTYIVMDYVEGTTLSDMIQREAPFTVWRAAHIARQIASGLSHAHRAGLIHRDVKPDNVYIVEENGEEVVKLLDFGIVASDRAEPTRLTHTGRIVGTPIYMSPEQARQGPITHSADLYSLGVILYEMLSGRPPFEGGVGEVLVDHALTEPPSLDEEGGLENLAMWLLAKQPADRPDSAHEVIAEVDELILEWSGIIGFDWPSERTPIARQISSTVDPLLRAPSLPPGRGASHPGRASFPPGPAASLPPGPPGRALEPLGEARDGLGMLIHDTGPLSMAELPGPPGEDGMTPGPACEPIFGSGDAISLMAQHAGALRLEGGERETWQKIGAMLAFASLVISVLALIVALLLPRGSADGAGSPQAADPARATPAAP